MGLHRDGAPFGLSPFEVEQRRRLWWTIVGYDRRIGEMTGSTVTALSSGGDCRLPLNINDTDLHEFGKDAPTPTQVLNGRFEAPSSPIQSSSCDPQLSMGRSKCWQQS
jgi:hypothetical protein